MSIASLKGREPLRTSSARGASGSSGSQSSPAKRRFTSFSCASHRVRSAAASSRSRFCSVRYGPVRNISRKISWRLFVPAVSSLRKSPWAIIAICEKRARSRPVISATRAVTSFVFVTTEPSGRVRSASACCTTVPLPRRAGRWYSGLRRTVYVLPAQENVSSTQVGVSGAAYCERNMEGSRVSPLASP